MTVHRVGVDPQWNYDVTWNPQIDVINICSILEKILWIEKFFIQRIHVFPIQKKFNLQNFF